MRVKHVWLLPERALWWPAGRVLFVADLHLGKPLRTALLVNRACRAPRENLARLGTLLRHYQPQQLIFLGDLLHAAPARTPSVLQGLAAWRESFAALDCVLVRGNHDSRAGDPPASLRIRVVDEPFAVGRLPPAIIRSATTHWV